MRKALVIAVIALVILTSFALAGDNAVVLDTSSVVDGQSDVAVDVVIELTFTNNVVNKAVAQANAKCITLTSGGENLSLIVEMADDQIEPDMKRVISIAPVDTLDEGTRYELTISAKLCAKNGSELGQDVVIVFITRGADKSASDYWWLMAIVFVGIGAAVIISVRNRKRGKKE